MVKGTENSTPNRTAVRTPQKTGRTPQRPASSTKKRVMTPLDLPTPPDYRLKKSQISALDMAGFKKEQQRLDDARKKAETEMEFIEAQAYKVALEHLRNTFEKVKVSKVSDEFTSAKNAVDEKHADERAQLREEWDIKTAALKNKIHQTEDQLAESFEEEKKAIEEQFQKTCESVVDDKLPPHLLILEKRIFTLAKLQDYTGAALAKEEFNQAKNATIEKRRTRAQVAYHNNLQKAASRYNERVAQMQQHSEALWHAHNTDCEKAFQQLDASHQREIRALQDKHNIQTQRLLKVGVNSPMKNRTPRK